MQIYFELKKAKEEFDGIGKEELFDYETDLIQLTIYEIKRNTDGLFHLAEKISQTETRLFSSSKDHYIKAVSLDKEGKLLKKMASKNKELFIKIKGIFNLLKINIGNNFRNAYCV